MILDNSLIAYEYYKGQYTPDKVEESGSKDNIPTEDKYSFNKNEIAVLVLEDDIINSEGYGLKKGFYSVVYDKYMDFLLILQEGKLKAKVPVVKMTKFETINEQQFKPKKMSYSKFIRQQEKEKRKYFAGQNPSEINFKDAQIHYIDEENSYLLIYTSNNIELTGLIKF